MSHLLTSGYWPHLSSEARDGILPSKVTFNDSIESVLTSSSRIYVMMVEDRRFDTDSYFFFSFLPKKTMVALFYFGFSISIPILLIFILDLL